MMIRDTKVTKDAAAYVKGHKPADVHPDVASLMATFTRAQGRGEQVAAEAHGRSLLRLVNALGDSNVPHTADASPVRQPRRAAKKSAAKKSAGSRSRG